MSRSRLESILSNFVTVHPHEISSLLHSSSCFFFILSAYFVVLPLRDEGAISLGLSNLPGLFVGSLLLTVVAAPVSTLIFSKPNLSKAKALVLIHRFFSISLLLFFFLWQNSPSKFKAVNDLSTTSREDPKVDVGQGSPENTVGWENHGWFYVSVRIGFFLWVALLNLITISSTWARIIDVMDTESGSRLFGFIGAGATLGQLFGSLFATVMARLGPFLLLVASLLMEFAAQSSVGIKKEISHIHEEMSPTRDSGSGERNDAYSQTFCADRDSSPKSPSPSPKTQIWSVLDGLRLILSSTYLLCVSLFLWLSAVVSSFFYFQKMSVVAMTVSSSIGRRRLFAQINGIIAAFILAGQLTLTGRILIVAGVTAAICSAPFIAFSNMIALALWPTWMTVAISETLRKVVTYVVTRPGRELLFTVVSQDEKYKAKVCIDVIVQRLGDATAAGIYQLLLIIVGGKTSTASLCALPVCLLWIATAFCVGQRQAQLAKFQSISAL